MPVNRYPKPDSSDPLERAEEDITAVIDGLRQGVRAVKRGARVGARIVEAIEDLAREARGEVEVLPICRTCRGSRRVGAEGAEVPCPVCSPPQSPQGEHSS